MRNHELVPVELIGNIAHLKHGGLHKVLSTLLRHKLVAHSSCEYSGYRLSYLGYDILALHALLARGVVTSVGNQIGVGKESDIFEALDPEGGEVVLKLHRLGRTSFRAVRRSRDYLRGKSKASWLYMSRLAAVKEFAFMRALHAHGFPTPVPIDQSRHIVVMSRIAGCPLSQLRAGSLGRSEAVYEACLSILVRLAEHGLVHCDLNEFNLMIDPAAAAAAAGGSEGEQVAVTLIDFPQMVSSSHPNAEELFQRDLKGLRKFFATKMRCPAAMLARAEASEEDDGEEEEEEADTAGAEGGRTLLSGRPGSLTLASIAESSRSRRAAQDQQDQRGLDMDLAAEALAALTAEEQSALEAFLHCSRQSTADLEGDPDHAVEEDDEDDSGGGEEEGDIDPEEKEKSAESVFRCGAAGAGAGADGEQEQEEEEERLEDAGSSDGQDDGLEQGRPPGVTDSRDNSERAGRGRGRGRGRRPPHGSRNMTKKINKYGRIVRSERIDAAY